MDSELTGGPREPVPTNTSDPRLADLCFDLAKAKEAYFAANEAFYKAREAVDHFLEDVMAHQVAPKG